VENRQPRLLGGSRHQEVRHFPSSLASLSEEPLNLPGTPEVAGIGLHQGEGVECVLEQIPLICCSCRISNFKIRNSSPSDTLIRG
jgi:hypothetical protein